LSEDERREAMNRAFKQACARLELTGSPVVELVAVRILELARDGEFDPERLTEATVSTFEGVAKPAVPAHAPAASRAGIGAPAQNSRQRYPTPSP
jgi:hypothetical protein